MHPLQKQRDFRSLAGRLSARSLVHEARHVLATEGGRGFFTGTAARVVKRSIGTAVTWTLFEQFKIKLGHA